MVTRASVGQMRRRKFLARGAGVMLGTAVLGAGLLSDPPRGHLAASGLSDVQRVEAATSDPSVATLR